MPLPGDMSYLDMLQGQSRTGSTTTSPPRKPLEEWHGPYAQHQDNLEAAGEVETMMVKHRKLVDELLKNMRGAMDQGSEEAWYRWAAERAWAMLLGRPWPDETPSSLPMSSAGPSAAEEDILKAQAEAAFQKGRGEWYDTYRSGYQPPGAGGR